MMLHGHSDVAAAAFVHLPEEMLPLTVGPEEIGPLITREDTVQAALDPEIQWPTKLASDRAREALRNKGFAGRTLEAHISVAESFARKASRRAIDSKKMWPEGERKERGEKAAYHAAFGYVDSLAPRKPGLMNKQAEAVVDGKITTGAMLQNGLDPKGDNSYEPVVKEEEEEEEGEGEGEPRRRKRFDNLHAQELVENWLLDMKEKDRLKCCVQ